MNYSKSIKTCIYLFALFGFSAVFAATAQPKDSDIMAAIKGKISNEKTTANLPVKITIKDGVVTLSGKVDTDVEASKVIELAESTPGVKDVNEEKLTVKESKQPATDAYITAKVKGTFTREKLFGDKDIALMNVTVETTNGVVYLTGNVETQEQADNAVTLAKSVDGVKSVESKLAVQPAS